MTVPDGAELEVDLGGIAVWDVSHLLPKHQTKRYQKRELSAVTHLFVHHSGRLGKPGYQGLLNSTRYVVTHRGFPGCAYHLWIPFYGSKDSEGRLIVYRANRPETRSWHTGGRLNGFGESLCLQGNTTQKPLSPSQKECLEALLPWRWDSIPSQVTPTLSWHSEANLSGGKPKPACPGKNAVAWLETYRPLSDWLSP